MQMLYAHFMQTGIDFLVLEDNFSNKAGQNFKVFVQIVI